MIILIFFLFRLFILFQITLTLDSRATALAPTAFAEIAVSRVGGPAGTSANLFEVRCSAVGLEPHGFRLCTVAG